jgi:hypothetical protein
VGISWVFAATQLPMGHWLDQKGPKKVVLSFWVSRLWGA